MLCILWPGQCLDSKPVCVFFLFLCFHQRLCKIETTMYSILLRRRQCQVKEAINSFPKMILSLFRCFGYGTIYVSKFVFFSVWRTSVLSTTGLIYEESLRRGHITRGKKLLLHGLYTKHQCSSNASENQSVCRKNT